MKLFVESTSIEEIRQLADVGLVDGVSVSLNEVMDAGAGPGGELKERVAAIAQAFAVPICVPIPVTTYADAYQDGRELARGMDHCMVQIPFLKDTVLPIRKLVADGIKVCATHVYNGAQAFLAAKVGVSTVTIPADDLDAHGQRSMEVVAEIREVLDRGEVECDLMVSSVHNAKTFADCVLAGATSVCVAPDLLQEMMVHAFADRSIGKVIRDLSGRRVRGSH